MYGYIYCKEVNRERETQTEGGGVIWKITDQKYSNIGFLPYKDTPPIFPLFPIYKCATRIINLPLYIFPASLHTKVLPL